jgi:hypothetical protein
MAARDFEFQTIQTTGGLREALVTATMSSADTLEITDPEFRVEEIVSAIGQRQDNGLMLQFEADDNELELKTASLTNVDVVVRILY